MTRYAKGRKCNRYLRGNLSTDTNPEITNGGAKDAKATIKTMNRYLKENMNIMSREMEDIKKSKTEYLEMKIQYLK